VTLRDVVVKGAREHNLQGVDVTIPRLALTTITGVSGSGKSSLAFDTIYQEGQRRYVESLSSYARQFLGRMEKPKIDQIDGLSPTLLIDQKTVNRNPRSTVGTVTEIYDSLRLLFARMGIPHCTECGLEVKAQAADSIVETIFERWKNKRVSVLAPIVRDRKGTYRRDMEGWRLKGYTRIWVDGSERRLDEEIELVRNERHSLELVIDRVRLESDRKGRLGEAVETACRLADGFVYVRAGAEGPVAFSTRNTCPEGHGDFPELEPRLFSFNSPHGACAACEGLGKRRQPDPDLLIADASLSIREGALKVSNKSGYMSYVRLGAKSLQVVSKTFDVDLDTPWEDLPKKARRLMLYGSGEREVTLEWDWSSKDGAKTVHGSDTKPFEGLIPAIERHIGLPGFRQVERFLATRICAECGGTRLNASARAVTVRDKRLDEISALTVEEARSFFEGLSLEGREALIGKPVVREITKRLEFLDHVGLSYLSLDRNARSLSGGEAQRVRLATQVGSGLQGVLYILDEPSIGLHARDNQRLIRTLHLLRDRGNTVLVVEHDEETILASDYIIDIGPGAGSLGGHVLGAGTVSSVLRGERTLTTDYLTHRRSIEIPAERRAGSGKMLSVLGASARNLDGLDVHFPLGCLIAVTGVSGSGKSTLVDHVLRRALAQTLHRSEKTPGEHREITGVEHIDKVIEIDQQPIGRTPRSNPATYTGVMDLIRDVFANTPEAKVRGYAKGRFSFNVKGGRCEACEGAGVNTIEMQFLPDVEVPCEVCDRRRYNSETLEVQYRGLSVDQILDMTIDEALVFFEHHRKSARILQTLHDVGLGYVRLGQPSTTLSGGEAQRMKLASELCRPATGKTLYVLDEPTTGLHFEDIRVLIIALQRLVDAGNTLIVVEHNLDVVKVADHIIDMGPEGGGGGGLVVACGTPEEVALSKKSHTARALKPLLKPQKVRVPATQPGRRKQAVAPRALVVKGAALHNLQGVNAKIPHGSLTVVTGPSGSGKTSLAFDTLFAEGQRRFVESLSTYARRFLERMQRPPVESIEGLAPAIAIDQKTASRNPRSTVATSTEIHDYLRLLFSRVGKAHCWTCGRRLQSWSSTLAAEDLVARGGGQRVHITASLYSKLHKHPTALSRPGEVMDLREELLGDGFARLLVDGKEARLDDLGSTVKSKSIELVVDRLKVDGSRRTRLAEAIGLAQQRGLGLAHVHLEDGELLDYEARAGCARCGNMLPAGGLTPRMFSFNSHAGACSSCEGMGRVLTINEERLIDRPNRPLLEDGMTSKVGRHISRKGGWYSQVLHQVAERLGGDISRPWSTLSRRVQKALLHGTGSDAAVPVHYEKHAAGRTREVDVQVTWQGLLPLVQGWWRGTEKEGWWRAALEALMRDDQCLDCQGGRLRPEALATRIGKIGIRDLSQQTVAEAHKVMGKLKLKGNDDIIGRDILYEVQNRLDFLMNVGLGYLSLSRSSSTLSGGEAQRIRLASQLGNRLVGVLYVLDEPSIGLHPRDQAQLLKTLMDLRDLGNTIVVVEHDNQTIEAADHIIDLGPGAGRHGGKVVAAGPPAKIRASRRSLTGRYLSGKAGVPVPETRREGEKELVVRGARLHNLKKVTARFPLKVLSVVTGVSGSGKSSLVTGLLVPAVQAELVGDQDAPEELTRISGVRALDKLLVIDQSPLGRSPHSNSATYTGAFGEIRNLFAGTPEARMRGFGPGRFSCNVKGGRCENCQGRGVEIVEMHFLSDVSIPCDVCNGRRYGRETLEVRWQGHTIADVLDMDVDTALNVFSKHKRISKKLSFLSQVGLGYLKLGQPATTLSGGEAQRVKLASELSRPGTGRSLVVLDEPTTGLHADDVARLVKVLQAMVDQGNTVVVIEHNLDVIKCADHVIDMGPEGGSAGGRIVAAGTPEEIAAQPKSHTGRFLAPLLELPEV
jgi:excinuclease ABC subunit A